MATLQGWRRAYGAIKDTTTVGLAHVNSDYKDLDVAIVKATNHVERPPKERHLRKIMVATSAIRPRADVMYCIHALSRRLTKTRNWTVALKTLVVLHRNLREGDPTFREELLNVSHKGRILQLSNFKDDSSPIAWDCSGWVRTYALFLEERLECFKILKYDIEAERLPRPAQGIEKGYSRTRDLDSEDLLEHLPALQQLLYRLIGCRPEGAASSNYLIQYALALVLKESFKIYCAINDGIINLVDKFFEMPRHEAIKALEVYRRAGQQAGSLSDFYEVCKSLELARNFQFPVLREPPQSFLLTMEEYIREAPRIVNPMKEPLEFQERLQLTYKPDISSPPPEPTLSTTEPVDSADCVSFTNTVPVYPPTKTADIADLLGLDASTSGTPQNEEYNALALAMVPSDIVSTDHHAPSILNEFDPTGWELALVPSTSNGSSAIDNTQLSGRFDSLTLNSLYDEGAYRVNQQSATATTSVPTNPFDGPDPFSLPAHPSNSAQMSHLQQNSYIPYPYVPPQQHPQEMGQTSYLQPHMTHHLYPPQPPVMQQQQQQQQQQMLMGASNPFEDGGYGGFGGGNQSTATPSQQQAANPFGNGVLL